MAKYGHNFSFLLTFLCFFFASAKAQNNNLSLLRGPYLQMGTPNEMTVCWRTDLLSDTKLTYGTSLFVQDSSITSKLEMQDHCVRIKNLLPNTKYYYSVGSKNEKLAGDSSHYFITAPLVGTTPKMRFWVTGDCGNNSQNQRNVLSEYEKYLGDKYTNAWLLLGDNAYYNGFDNEYQTGFFDIYKNKMLRQTLLMPAPGNHDYAGDNNRQDDHQIPYYSIFSLPEKGQMGGFPSGTEAFYSYDYGNVHFISLDSYGREDSLTRLYDTLGTQVLWLKRDLETNTQPWTIAYWHHPPYSMGSHNSDTETPLVLIRQNLLKILERYKVDLVMCGHTHGYERSYLIHDYVGMEADFQKNIYALDSSSAKYNGERNSCPYVKNTDSQIGTVYVVAGSAGQVGGSQGSFPHNAMSYSNVTNGGSLILEIEDNRLDAKWLCSDGQIRDNFTIFKNVNQRIYINMQSGDTLQLSASWTGDYVWQDLSNDRDFIDVPFTPITYFVTDSLGCLKDEFHVQFPSGNACPKEMFMHINPNPAQENTFIEYCLESSGYISFSILNILGQSVLKIPSFYNENGQHSFSLNEYRTVLPRGIYVVRMEANGQIWQEKCVF